MAGWDDGAPKLSAALKTGLLATASFVAALTASGDARAACAPAAASNIAATCTGVTINQNGTSGYGTGSQTNLAVTIVSGASVAGTAFGLQFSTGSVVNYGDLSSGGGAISADSVTANNYGTISGLRGVDSTVASVANYGVMTGLQFGVLAGTASILNTGTITGTGAGSAAIETITGAVTATNSGTMSGVAYGIFAATDATVTNSNVITGGPASAPAATPGSAIPALSREPRASPPRPRPSATPAPSAAPVRASPWTPRP